MSAPLFRVFAYLRRYPSLAYGLLACVMLMAASVIAFPLVTRHITNQIIPNPSEHKYFIPFVFLAFGGFILREGMNALRIFLNNHLEQHVIFDIRSDLYKKIQKLPVNWFDTRRTGDLMTRVVEDVTAMERILIDGIELGVVSIVQIITILIVFFYTDTSIALWACTPIPFLIYGAIFYSKSARQRHHRQRTAASNLNSLLHDNIAGIRQIKSFSQEDQEHRHFNQLSHQLRLASLNIMKWWGIYNPSMSLIEMIGYTLVLGFGGHEVIRGEMKLGDLLFFFLLLNYLYSPIANLRQLNNLAFSSRAAADRVFEIMDTPDEPHHDSGIDLPSPAKGRIEFKNLSFSHHRDQSSLNQSPLTPSPPTNSTLQPTLNKVSFTVQPGQTIAFVGATGAGKSTLVNLLCRFYEYTEGSITIDGFELSKLSKSSLRNNIGYVTQEAFLFNGSIRDNLLMAKRDARPEELQKALDTAYATPFVQKLPEGIDTIIGERGVKLSGGERQRLSIARTLLKNPPILLLDEATASVDSKTESIIQAALDELLKNRTSFIIAHRLSTIKNADCIHVLNAGTLIESGTHAELIAQGGAYASLSRQSFLA